MPNRQTHAKAGAITGTISVLSNVIHRELKKKNQNPDYSFGVDDFFRSVRLVAIGTVSGYAGGILPDVIEPPIHSWHRKGFHSATAGAVLSYSAIKSQFSDLDENLQAAILGGGTGYLSHIVLDSQTPRGIPFFK